MYVIIYADEPPPQDDLEASHQGSPVLEPCYYPVGGLAMCDHTYSIIQSDHHLHRDT